MLRSARSRAAGTSLAPVRGRFSVAWMRLPARNRPTEALRIAVTCPRFARSAILGAAALAVLAIAVWVNPDPTRAILGCILGWSLLALAWIDWHTMRLPDALTLPLLCAGIASAWLDSPGALYSSVVGALAG